MKITKNYLKQVIKEELGRMDEAGETFKVGQIVSFERAGKQEAGVFMGDGKVRPLKFALSNQEANYPAKNIKSTTLDELVSLIKGEHAQDKEAGEFYAKHGTSGEY